MRTISPVPIERLRQIYVRLDVALQRLGYIGVGQRIAAGLMEIELMGPTILDHAKRLKNDKVEDDDLLVLRNAAWEHASSALNEIELGEGVDRTDSIFCHLMQFEFCVGRMCDRLRTRVPTGPKRKEDILRKIAKVCATLPAGADQKQAVFDAREALGLNKNVTARTVQNYISLAKKLRVSK